MVFNNTAIYNAALAGATGGSCQRWLTRKIAGQYTDLVADMVIFATAVDYEIATTTVSQADADLMESICSQVMAGRYPRSLTSLGTVNIAQAIKALWTQTKASLDPADIPASITPLTFVSYVDEGATGTPDGSISAPYPTIQAAVDAAVSGSTLLIAPGDYSAEDVAIVGKVISLVGLLPASAHFIDGLIPGIDGPNSVVSDSLLTISNMPTIGSVTGGDAVYAYDCGGEGITAVGTLTANRCRIDGPLNGGELQLNGVTCAGITITDATGSRILNSDYNELIGPPGSLVEFDSYSAGWVAPTGGLVQSVKAPRVSVVVTVPVMAANAIGTATANFTGTVLEGLVVDRQVYATEPTAGITGGGFIAGVRMTATNVITFKFHGPCTGGDQTFIVTQV